MMQFFSKKFSLPNFCLAILLLAINKITSINSLDLNCACDILSHNELKSLSCSINSTNLGSTHFDCVKIDNFFSISMKPANNWQRNIDQVYPLGLSKYYKNTEKLELKLYGKLFSNFPIDEPASWPLANFTRLTYLGLPIVGFGADATRYDLNSCVFSRLKYLQSIMLNCGWLRRNRALTFNSLNLSTILLVKCLKYGLQFDCVRCSRVPSSTVIRFSDGPSQENNSISINVSTDCHEDECSVEEYCNIFNETPDFIPSTLTYDFTDQDSLTINPLISTTDFNKVLQKSLDKPRSTTISKLNVPLFQTSSIKTTSSQNPTLESTYKSTFLFENYKTGGNENIMMPLVADGDYHEDYLSSNFKSKLDIRQEYLRIQIDIFKILFIVTFIVAVISLVFNIIQCYCLVPLFRHQQACFYKINNDKDDTKDINMNRLLPIFEAKHSIPHNLTNNTILMQTDARNRTYVNMRASEIPNPYDEIAQVN